MGQPRRPVIGITCYVESIDRPPWVSQPSAVLPRMYLEHVARAGGIPVILPPGEPTPRPTRRPARCLTGSTG